MKSKIILICVFGILFIACKKDRKLHNFMVGNWQTEYMKIEMPTVKKTDSLHIMEEDFSNPKSTRARSTYNNDGTFTSWYKKFNGKIVGKTKGTWITKKDSLFLDYTYLGKKMKLRYAVSSKKDTFEGTVVYDWDNDGEFDDRLFMIAKRITLE